MKIHDETKFWIVIILFSVIATVCAIGMFISFYLPY